LFPFLLLASLFLNLSFGKRKKMGKKKRKTKEQGTKNREQGDLRASPTHAIRMKLSKHNM